MSRAGAAVSTSPEPDGTGGGALAGSDQAWKQFVPSGGPAVGAVALMDLELRTFVASVVALSSAPATVLRRVSGGHRAAAEFYAALSAEEDPDVLFPAPPEGVDVQARRPRLATWQPSSARVELLSFRSPYRVVYGPSAERYESHRRNLTATAMHWRHDGGPRPTILVVHGFTGSPYWLNSSFFQLPWFFGHECDVVLATLPFHGPRNDRPALFSGSTLFGEGLATFTEAMLQSVTDLRVLVDYLQATGVDRIGITGLSLGGYVTALMAAVEPRLHFAIPNAAVTDMATLIDGWFPANRVIKAGLRLGGVPPELHTAALRLHSPLRFRPRLPRDRLFIIGGLADRLSPPEQSARLWEHWERPRIHWFPGSHILHIRRAVYLRAIGHFLRDTGFSPG